MKEKIGTFIFFLGLFIIAVIILIVCYLVHPLLMFFVLGIILCMISINILTE